MSPRRTAARRYVAKLTSDQDLILAYDRMGSGWRASVPIRVDSYKEALPLLVGGDVDAVLVIPPNFAERVHGGKAAQVQAIIDGTDPLAGSQAIAALQARSGVFGTAPGAAGSTQQGQPMEIRTQAWYNAGLESLLSMVPGLLAIVLIMPTMALTMALTREKETGTLEGLMATPVSGLEYVTGKLLTYIATGLVGAILALLVAILWFRVPFRGSLMVYLLMTGAYLLACMGAAVVIASFAKSQQTAMFIVLLIFLVPSFFLAGLITPIGTESLGTLLASYALPTTHFVKISRAVFLKGLGIDDLLRPTLILLGMGIGALCVGLWLFRKKVA
jgi:ABC-2 type transport system permease protein